MSDTATLRAWFDDFTVRTGESPIWIVFAEHHWPVERNTLIPFGKVGDDVLDRKFDAGWGCTEAPSFHAWSESWVLFAGTHDGSEWLAAIPRNPTAAAIPEHVGGG